MSEQHCLRAMELAGLNNQQVYKLMRVAKKAANKGGKVLMKHYGQILNIRDKGNPGDLVTNADVQAEEIIIRYLKKETPQIEILAEESGSSGSNNELFWCIDPLDGTTNFTHSYPFFATSIGLCWNGLPILGAISVPFLNETYWAAPGIGSFCNRKRLNVSTKSKLEDALLVTGFAYDRFTNIDNNYAEFCWMTHRTRGVRRGGAAAVDLAFVAAGRVDGFWERGLAPWDMAAGVPIVELANGVITDYKSDIFSLSTGRILACTKGIEKELINQLKGVKPLEAKSFGAVY